MFNKKNYSQLSEDELFILKLEKKKKRNKIIKIAVGVVVVVILVFVLFNVFFGSGVGTKFDYDGVYAADPKPSKGKVSNDEGMTEFANNGVLKLEYSPSEDLFIITDLASGEQFRSWPEPKEDEKAERAETDTYVYDKYKVNHSTICSPVLVGFTNSGLDGGFVYAVNQFKKVTKTVNKIENGVQLFYKIGDIEAEFYVEFTLEDNAVVFNFPSNGLKEKEPGKGESLDRMPRIGSISGLNYISSARQGDEGYYVVPDGSGAITYFDSARVTTYDEYNKLVYGTDMTFESLTSPDFNNVTATMPVCGMIKNNVMISYYATEGETVASIMMGNPGVRGLQLYSMGMQFQLRRFYYTQTTKDLSAFLQMETEFSAKSVQEKIYFDVKPEGEEFTYIDLANKTREFLLEKWGGKELAQDASALNIKVFLGAENTSSTIFDSVKVMTTFEEVKDIYSGLEGKGITDIRLSLLGWMKDGYYGIATKKYSPDSAFGGASKLKSLTEWADEKGITLSVENNLIMLYGNPSTGNSLRSSVIKEPGTSYLTFRMVSNAGVYRNGTSYYVLSPSYYEKKFLSKDLSKLSGYGIKNVDLLTVGDTLMTDYNKANAALRSQVRDMYVDWIEEYKTKFDTVSVYYGNEYAVAVADYVLDIPLQASTALILDETIPFIQIVYHGLVDYYSEPINKADDMLIYTLKSIEYGALFSYELTYNSTEQLKYTYYNKLFRSQYTDLLDDIEAGYAISETVIKPLRDQKIVNHYKLGDANAYCTVYENGTKIYVNYSEEAINVENVTVPALWYCVA